MSEQDRDALAEALAKVAEEHEYALGVGRGGICGCGFVPTVHPETLATQQEYHRAHLADEQAKALLLRIERSIERGAKPPIRLWRWVGPWWDEGGER